jgi:hypothetical protein
VLNWCTTTLHSQTIDTKILPSTITILRWNIN